jgi:hypothetical protein
MPFELKFDREKNVTKQLQSAGVLAGAVGIFRSG